MANPRQVTAVITPQLVIEGAGVLLRRSFAPTRANPFDPFLLFDNFAFNDPADAPNVGFPTHPHRGIETVTYMLKGSVRHRDSLGNVGLIGPGDLQWMTAGRGILHEEMPRPGPGGIIYGFQLWVNLPSGEKMSAPRYRSISADMIPAVQEGGCLVRVIAGAYAGRQGPVGEITAQPRYMDIEMNPGSDFKTDIPAGHTALAYLFEGEAEFGVGLQEGGTVVQAARMVVLGDGTGLHVRTGQEKARFVLISGAPMREAIVPFGPFVMNTVAEIEQALAELKAGTFIR